MPVNHEILRETTTSIYLHADMQLKERALAATTAKNVPIPRYRPSDRVMEFLKGL